jgi:hypothetical protein
VDDYTRLNLKFVTLNEMTFLQCAYVCTVQFCFYLDRLSISLEEFGKKLFLEENA